MSEPKLKILLVEDNAADAKLGAKLIARRAEISPEDIALVASGEEAIRTLSEAASHDPASLPNLVFLDLNLPGVSGIEVLRTARAHPQLRGMPIIVLSSSTAPSDVNQAYEHGATAYLRKAPDLAAYESLLDSIAGFWFQRCQLPEWIDVPENA